MTENDLAFNSKKKLYVAVQLIKIVIGFCVTVVSMFILTLNKFDFYIPYLASSMVFSGLVAIILNHKIDAKLKFSPFIISTFDLGAFWLSIILSGFLYNTIFFWCAGLIVMTYFFTNFKFALSQAIITMIFVSIWVMADFNDHQIISTDISYAKAFLISAVANLTFVFSMFFFSQKIQEQYIYQLKNAQNEITIINSFPILNPNPIFSFQDEELLPKNKVARNTILESHNNQIEELIALAKKIIEIKKPITKLLKLGDLTYKVNGVENNGRVNFYLADVTELLETKKEFEKKEQYNRAIIDAIPGFVSWIDSDLNYLGVNDHMCDFFNKNQKDFIGNKIGDVSADEESAVAIYAKNLFSQSQDIIQKEFPFIHNGKKYWSYITLKKYNNGKNAILVSSDITSLKTAETKILEEQKRSESSARLASIGEMAAGIAHEINNPLAILNGVAFRMKKLHEKSKLTDDKIFDNLSKLTAGVERIQRIISGVKNLSREGSNDPYEFTSFKEILDDSLVLLSKKCQHHNIDLLIPKFSENLGLNCQRVQISQILVIMINNAIDAIDSLEDKWIKIDVTDSIHNIEIKITDSGYGIPSDIANKIFDPFYTTKGVGKGTGLGLSLANKIVQQHHGEFHLDHNNKNTCFIIKFPKNLEKSAA